MLHGTVTEDRRWCCKPALLFQKRCHCFQSPGPWRRIKMASILRRAPLHAGRLPGAAKTVFSSPSLAGFSLLSWKISKPSAVDKTTMVRHQVTGRRLSSTGHHRPSQAEKMGTEAAFFILWEILGDELDFYLETFLCSAFGWKHWGQMESFCVSTDSSAKACLFSHFN